MEKKKREQKQKKHKDQISVLLAGHLAGWIGNHHTAQTFNMIWLDIVDQM